MKSIEVTIQNLIGSGMDPKTENNPYLGFIYTSFQASHPHTHPPTHSYMHSFTHSRTTQIDHSFTHALIYSVDPLITQWAEAR